MRTEDEMRVIAAANRRDSAAVGLALMEYLGGIVASGEPPAPKFIAFLNTISDPTKAFIMRHVGVSYSEEHAGYMVTIRQPRNKS